VGHAAGEASDGLELLGLEELLLETNLIGHVAGGDDDAAYLGVVAGVANEGVDQPVGAVLVALAKAKAIDAAGVREQPTEGGDDPRLIVGVRRLSDLEVERLLLGEPEDGGDPAADEEPAPVRGEHAGDVRRPFQHLAEERLAVLGPNARRAGAAGLGGCVRVVAGLVVAGLVDHGRCYSPKADVSDSALERRLDPPGIAGQGVGAITLQDRDG